MDNRDSDFILDLRFFNSLLESGNDSTVTLGHDLTQGVAALT